MSICTIGCFLNQVEDQEIRSVLEFALALSQAHVQKVSSLDPHLFPSPKWSNSSNKKSYFEGIFG